MRELHTQKCKKDTQVIGIGQPGQRACGGADGAQKSPQALGRSLEICRIARTFFPAHSLKADSKKSPS
jgi:hypothetical protein